MKTPILFLFCVIVFGAISASAQCDPASASPIKCSYYNEGFQDGANDATNNLRSDYRRYKDKFERKYEDTFRIGYEAGFNSIPLAGPRWSNSQRSAYDSGYTIGQNDRQSNGQGRPGEPQGRYDQNIGLYFQQGYNDGFNNRSRQYDVVLNGNGQIYPPNPGGGTTSGSATWSGRVDDRANIIFRANTIYAEHVSGNQGTQTSYQNVNGPLPRRDATVTARITSGRGSISITQQPNRSNNYTAVAQVYDPKGGAENYSVEMVWMSQSAVEEPYRSGGVNWSGRVDGTVNIVISGSDVQSVDTTGNGMYNVNFNINGYLARRPGNVSARKRKGSGQVTVLQQPSRDNDFTAIIQVYDPKRGADNYQVDISW